MRNRSLPAAGAALILTLAGFGLAGPASAGSGANQGASGAFYNDCQTSNSCLPSANGNGDSDARPAAGSVGNADVKSPPGQSKNDKNKGYECDDNNGIAKGNPAHSGCTPEDPEGPT